ncbi:protein-tyrosine phosphatase family protein [Singulisphaera sp. PoT]|uniref:protein-tyrosine phosphatase family protein n=1 Tax=Singulisphaera sp. PoT TaxID=3411797 RepID=UPI003BF57115
MRRIAGYPLWLGHAGDGRDLRAIHEAGIEAVVDLAANEPPAVLSRDLIYLRFPLADGPGNPPWLVRLAVESVAKLLASGTPTLVCCSEGLSRSPCIAAAAIDHLNPGETPQGLARIAGAGIADASPLLWAEVVRITANQDKMID